MAYWDGWNYQKEITVTPPTISGAVSSFCALIRLNSTNFDFTKAKSDGADIRFGWLDAPAFTLHYIHKWDSVAEEAIVSVFIPSIPVAGTTFYLFYGNSSADDASNSTAAYYRYRTKSFLARDESGDILEFYKSANLVKVGSGVYPAVATGLNFDSSEGFDGDTVAGCWKTATGQWFNIHEYDYTVYALAYPTVNDSVHRPVFAQGSLANTDFAMMLELYNGNWVFNNGVSVAANLNEWNFIAATLDFDGNMTISVNGGTPSSATTSNYDSTTDEDFYVGGSYAITTGGSERAFKGSIEFVAIGNPADFATVSSSDWISLMYADLIQDSLITVEAEPGGGSSSSSYFEDSSSSYFPEESSSGEDSSSGSPIGEDEEGPIASDAVIVDVESDKVISASVSFEPQGVASASLSAKYEIDVGTYVTIPDPITDVDIFRGIVTKCSYNYKTHRYDIQLRDPLMALSQESVLFSQTNMVMVLNEVVIDYGQAFYSVVVTDFEFAPVEVGLIIDPDNEVESDPVDWVGLVRTAERATGGVLTYRPNGQYRFDYPTSRGALSSSLLIQATTGLKDRYANRAICKCTGEWWEDPGEETTSTEFIYGAYRTVKRYGDQIRSISITTSDLNYTETFTYDAESYLTKHEVVSIQEDNSPLSGIARYRTTTTREWTITDEANYIYEEEVINEQQLEGEGSYDNLDRTVKTVTVAGGEILETFQRYGWNYESGWHVLMNDYTITGSGDEINSGDGSYYEIRGFLAQPGLTSYGVKSIYEYVWIDEIEGTYRRRLQKTEVLSSAVSEPGFKRVLPLKKYAVNYCVTADDTPAQTALGLMETFYSPITVKDDANLTVMKTIAEATLEWLGRCRLLTGTIPLSTGETWCVGDTFTWGGLTWTLEGLEHDIKARLTHITATSEASISWLKKSLLSEKDRLGNTIKGIARKEAEKYDNVEYATIIRMVDHETYVVKLSDGTVKIAHISFGEGVLLPAGSNVTVLRESLK